MIPTETSTHSTEPTYPPASRGWYAVVILTIAYVCSFLDRQILALLVEPIRQDLGISDTQISLLMGLAFAILYTLLGIPIGRLADRHSRRAIIATGITIWCIMTAACGLARNYVQLFLARIGVGVGEATLSPSALSLISDYFPRERRGRPIAFYNMGISVGAGIAMVIGGRVIQYVFNAKPVTLPIIGELAAWQTIFLIVGLPGLVVALLMTTVREPLRQGKIRLQTRSGGLTEEISIQEVVRFLLARWRTYATLYLGMSVVTILGFANLFWIPTMFIRTWNWSISEVSITYGLVILIVAPPTVYLAGWTADHFYGHGYKDAHLRTTLVGALILVPSSVLVPLMPTPELAVAMLVLATIGGTIPSATGTACLMMIAPNQIRGQVAALYYFVVSILGLTLGPTAVAMITDYVFGYDEALRYSLAIVSGVAGVASLAFLVACLKNYRSSVIEAETWTG